MAFARIVLRLLAGAVVMAMLAIRPRWSLEAENLVLRRQLGLFKERGVKPRRIDTATRVSVALLSRLCDWRFCVMVVRPETVVRWHRAGWTAVALQVAPGPPARSVGTAPIDSTHGHGEPAPGRGT